MGMLDFDTRPEALGSNAEKYEVIPEGTYQVIIESADYKPSKKNPANRYIDLKMKIQGPTHVGRYVWEILNVNNTNQVAEQIAREKLGHYLRALGLGPIKDTEKLVNGVAMIKIKHKLDSYDGEMKATVARVMAPQGSMPPASSAAPTATTAAPSKKAPWAKN